MSKLGGSKPKKSSLISNLLKRVDEKSLAVKTFKDNQIMIYWSLKKERHLKANKQILSLLSESELYQLLEGNELAKYYLLNMFKIETNIPERIVETKKEAVVVRSYKEIDKIGTSKGEQEIFDKKKTAETPIKTKRPRI
jgi:hypothetical protein